MPQTRINNLNLTPNGGDGNTNAWSNGLIVTDLVTGTVYRALQADYDRTRVYDPPSVVYFFPPFRTRHFSLTREVPPTPLPKELREGYKGFMGLIYNVFTNQNFGPSKGVQKILMSWRNTHQQRTHVSEVQVRNVHIVLCSSYSA
jgi:hypothetical protein